MGAHRGEAQRVAIGLGSRDQFSAQGAAAAGLVLHDERLADDLGHFLGNRAQEVVAVVAGLERVDQGDGWAGIFCLRKGFPWQGCRTESSGSCKEAAAVA